MSTLRETIQIARLNTMRQRMQRQYHLATCEKCRARQAGGGEHPLQALFKALSAGDDLAEQTHPAPSKAH